MELVKLLCHTCCQCEQAVRHRIWEGIIHFSPSSCKKIFTPPSSLFSSHPSMDLCCLWGSEYLIHLSFIYSFHLTVPLKSSLFLSVDHSSHLFCIHHFGSYYCSSSENIIITWFCLLLFHIGWKKIALRNLLFSLVFCFLKWHLPRQTNSTLIAQKAPYLLKLSTKLFEIK